MKALTFFAAATLLCCGCSKTRQTQADVYKAIESDLRLPSEEQARKGRYAEMRVAARLDESYNAISYDLMPIKLQKGRGDFFDSVVFLRTVHFLGPQHQSSVLEEEIYVLEYAVALVVHEAEHSLRFGIALLRRFNIPLHRFQGILRHAPAPLVHYAEDVLRVSISLFGLFPRLTQRLRKATDTKRADAQKRRVRNLMVEPCARGRPNQRKLARVGVITTLSEREEQDAMTFKLHVRDFARAGSYPVNLWNVFNGTRGGLLPRGTDIVRIPRCCLPELDINCHQHGQDGY